MGAFDTLSDDDPRVIAHESSKVHQDCGLKLSEYRTDDLIAELKRREEAAREKEARHKLYLELKKEFEP